MRLLFAFLFISFTSAYEQKVDIDYAEKGNIVYSKDLFVPLGYDGTIKCDAITKLSNVPIDIDKIKWYRIRYLNKIEIPLSDINNSSNERFYRIDNEQVYLLGTQMIHNETIVECHVPVDTDDKNAMNVTITTLFISRTRIVVQDCGTDDHLKAMNVFNPCMFGACIINKSDPFIRLECKCVEQYTGDFCEVQVDGIAWREIIFYSPVIAHIIGFCCFLFVQCCFPSRSKIKKTALTELLEATNKYEKPPFEKLYSGALRSRQVADLKQQQQHQQQQT